MLLSMVEDTLGLQIAFEKLRLRIICFPVPPDRKQEYLWIVSTGNQSRCEEICMIGVNTYIATGIS